MRKDLLPISNLKRSIKTKQNRDPESVILSASNSIVHTHPNLELSIGEKNYSFVVEWQMPEEDEKT